MKVSLLTSAATIDPPPGARRGYTIGKRKGLRAAWVARMIRNMIGHHHVGVFDFSVSQHRFDHIDVALVGIHLQEVIAFSSDVAKVDIEDLLS